MIHAVMFNAPVVMQSSPHGCSSCSFDDGGDGLLSYDIIQYHVLRTNQDGFCGILKFLSRRLRLELVHERAAVVIYLPLVVRLLRLGV